MIERLLPWTVATAETRIDRRGTRTWPGELAGGERCGELRRMEYATGRECARKALVALGHAQVAIPTGPLREPRWPPGIVGSITHCAGYRAAAVAFVREVRSVGIDAEPHEPNIGRVTAEVVAASERAELARLHDLRPEIFWDRVLFSAKESVFKAWFPLTRGWLDFHEVELRFDAVTGRFRAGLLVPGPVVDDAPLTELHGRWRVESGLVLTAVAILASPNVARGTVVHPCHG